MAKPTIRQPYAAFGPPTKYPMPVTMSVTATDHKSPRDIPQGYATSYLVTTRQSRIEQARVRLLALIGFCADWAARRGWGRLGRFRGGGGLCDQLSGWFCGLGLTLVRKCFHALLDFGMFLPC